MCLPNCHVLPIKPPGSQILLNECAERSNVYFIEPAEPISALIWERYKAHKRDTLKAVRRTGWSYVNYILQLSLDSGDSKPFWKYIKSQRQDSVGVSPLKSGRRLFSDSLDEAEILNTQFKSVFTKEDSSFIPKLYGPNYPTIYPLIINQNGVEKLLSGLNSSKAAGPDQIPCRILKELSVELAPIFVALLRQSLNTGALPSLSGHKRLFLPSIKRDHGVCQKTTARFPWLVYRASCSNTYSVGISETI